MDPTQPLLEIGMLLYPGLTLLDLIGPQTVFSWFANIHLVWKNVDPVVSDTGIGIQPSCTFETCPSELDILFVPGGFGQQQLMDDAEVLAFLADRAATSKYVTSVCSGSLRSGRRGFSRGTRPPRIGRPEMHCLRLERSRLTLAWLWTAIGLPEAASLPASTSVWSCWPDSAGRRRRSSPNWRWNMTRSLLSCREVPKLLTP